VLQRRDGRLIFIGVGDGGEGQEDNCPSIEKISGKSKIIRANLKIFGHI